MVEAGRFAFCIARDCLPAAREALAGWRRRAEQLPDPERRRQALASIDHKAFHSLGAAVFAAWAPAHCRRAVVDFAVALQTLSDYLDNLCDRGPPLSVSAMRRLHEAMAAAVGRDTPGAEGLSDVALRGTQGPTLQHVPGPLWRDVPGPAWHDTPGHAWRGMRGPALGDAYMEELVACCRQCLQEIPGYPAVEALNLRLARLYGQMQARKHAPPGKRRRLLARWFQRHAQTVPQLCWWEFAAACGSTLPIFALTALAACQRQPEPAPATVAATLQAYFPWVAALHILLDYLIDRAEDAHAGELNFAACFGSLRRAQARIRWLYRRSLDEARRLPQPGFHRLVVAGMAAVYLSDPKARHLRPLRQSLAAEDRLLAVVGPLVDIWRRWSPPAPPQLTPAAGRTPWLSRRPRPP